VWGFVDDIAGNRVEGTDETDPPKFPCCRIAALKKGGFEADLTIQGLSAIKDFSGSNLHLC
jgi:hypothetical protein